MRITFWGAARTVTGSQHLLDTGQGQYLLDCGQYQGRRREAQERNRNFPFNPSGVSAVVISHAHIDHTGNLPLLVKNGFTGPIYASAGTADLCRPMLADAAAIQEHDAAYLNKRARRRKSLGNGESDTAVEPLFTTEDAEQTFPHFRATPMDTPVDIGAGLTYTSFEAGHILGSTCVLLTATNGSGAVRLAYSGDVGRAGLPIIKDPERMPPADYLIVESTYGDRLHKPMEAVQSKLEDIVNRTWKRGGRVIVPAFAVGRTQQLVLMLHELMNAKRIPALPIFVDSPLAVSITEVFRKHTELFDEEALRFVSAGQDPFGFSRLRYIRDTAQSKALNDLHGPFMVISASGMCEAGRILHHLRNNIGNPRNTVLITGYQAEHTLGRKILERWPEVPIFGDMMPLRADVQKINELSGHADQSELLAWMEPMTPTLCRVFLVHGENTSQKALAEAIRARYKLDVVIPDRGDSFDLT
ncbi:MAG TPA: MBL fold metallo-hydrolase [Bryobacteraceae bacterium]|nr:MBL fold metallo-hydrolase [Bryobacteraceae bacterium]